MDKISKLIKNFLIDENRRPLYNEFSFQHELGIYLREKLEGAGYRVEFERNVIDFGIDKSKTEKKEIDIVIYKSINGKDRYAIELKYHPKGCNVPQRMFDSIVDIKFMEQLKEMGFSKTYVCVITEEHKLYTSRADNTELPVYDYFRKNKIINGEIENKINYSQEQRGSKRLDIKGKYEIKWLPLRKSSREEKEKCERKYYLMEVKFDV